MSARRSSHRTIVLIVSSASLLALIASSLRSTSKKPFCPMTRPLHSTITTSAHRVRFVRIWREEFFEVPYKENYRNEEIPVARLPVMKKLPVVAAFILLAQLITVDA